MILYIVSKLALNSTYFTRGLVKYASGRGYFRAVPASQNGDKFATSLTPPIVERLSGEPGVPRAEMQEKVQKGILPLQVGVDGFLHVSCV